MKVLVVEDEFYARKAMIRQIKKYDQDGLFEISEASNGEEGWEFCEKYKPELVLTDIRMPKMDGIQLLQEIRNNELKIKVIILSAYSDFEYARSAIVNGASDYLLKPIDDTALTECLNKFVTQHKIERKEALLSRKDMATQYILNSIQESKYSGFIEKNMFERVFPQYQLGVFLFLRDLFRRPGQSSLPFLLALTFPTQSLITQWGSTAGAGIFQTHVLILLSGNKKAPRRTVIKTG